MARLTVSIACFNRCEVTKRCIDHLRNHTKEGEVDFIITDNGSTDGTAEYLGQANFPGDTIILTYGKNLGFGEAHNEALYHVETEFFLVMNNDLFIQEEGWVEKILAPFEDENIALVGLEANPGSLNPDGSGFHGPKLEYIDGSFIAGRTELFREIGLFSPALKMFFFEDSDLSLRVRQMGFKIKKVNIRFIHERGTSANKIDRGFREGIIAQNRHVFHKRWGQYLSTRSMTNKILIKCVSMGGGDIIALTPVISALRRDHPTAHIDLDTNWPDVFVNNPDYDAIHKAGTTHKEAYDRVIDLSPNYASYDTICKSGEKIAATKVESERPKLYLTRLEADDGARFVDKAMKGKEILIVTSLLMSRKNWQGRNWELEKAQELIRLLKEDKKICVVEVGKGIKSTEEADLDLVNQTSLRELFAVILQANIFIGVDSLPFHVAQAFAKESYILFGATEPISRVVDFSKTFVIRKELACVGCYQAKGSSEFNRCVLGTESCMRDITPEEVYGYISGETSPIQSNMKYLQQWATDERKV